ncbi:MAG: tetratricopeptide repeat protein [Bdellovibrionota bacterium]
MKNISFKKSVLPLLAATALLVSVQPDAFAKKKSGEFGVEKQLRFKAGDEKGNEVKALKTELLVIKSEKRALDQLLKLERKYKNTRMEPEILSRLAELYMRRARSERFFEVHKNSDQVAVFAPTLVKEASEAGEIRKGIAIYKRIEEKFPNFRQMDLVKFNHAYAHQQLGELDKAEKLLGTLIKDHPTSPLVPDAYLAIGEINFGRRDFKTSLENFRAIRRYPQARVYPYGLYKAAWALYNMQRTDEGLKQLEDVVAFGRKVAEQNLDSKLDLRKEALGDMALFYSDVKKADEAVLYFKTQAAELDPVPYIMRLVELYNRHSSFKEIEAVLKDVIEQFPNSPTIAQAHEELMWNYERMKNRGHAGTQLAVFDAWCEAQVEKLPRAKKGEVATHECQAKIIEASRKLSGKWHALWKKQGGPDDLAVSSEKVYSVYLKHATLKEAELPTVRFAYSELLFALGKFRPASENYAMIEDYQLKGVKVEQKVSHDAAYGAIYGLEKANGNKWDDKDEKAFQVFADNYVKRHPQGQYAFDLRFKRAFIAYEKERYDEAAPQFKKIGWSDVPAGVAGADKIQKSQDLYLDILNVKKDYRAIKEAAKILMTKSGSDIARSQHVEKVYREAYFSEIQQTEEKGDLQGAVDAYKKFALENTQSELAPKAWWNASQLQFRLGDAQGGANTCFQMHNLFPKAGNGKDCLTQAAQTFEAMARLDLAAKVLLNLAEVEKDKQSHWREIAADFFALSGDQDRAVEMYQALADGAKGGKRLALLEKMASIARETGDSKAVAKLEAVYSSEGIEPQASRLIVEQAEQAFEKKDYNKAFNLSKKIISRDSLPKDLLARARFVQASVLEDEYRRQSVKTRVDRIGIVLAIKTEKLEKAQKAFQSTAKYGDPGMSVRALRSLGNLYIDYAKTVREMTVVAHLPDADQKAFKAEIEQLAVPMEEKGIEAMGQALEAAKKAKLRDGQIAEIQLAVNKLNMKNDPSPAVQVKAPAIYVPKFGFIKTAGVGL